MIERELYDALYRDKYGYYFAHPGHTILREGGTNPNVELVAEMPNLDAQWEARKRNRRPNPAAEACKYHNTYGRNQPVGCAPILNTSCQECGVKLEPGFGPFLWHP